MSVAQTTTPNDLLIETIAALLVKVGGYKDPAEAVLAATEMIESIASSDDIESGDGLLDFQNLVIRAVGATSYIEQATQDDADQSVRFVTDTDAAEVEAEKTPGVSPELQDLAGDIRNSLAKVLGVNPDDLIVLPAGVSPLDLFGRDGPLTH